MRFQMPNFPCEFELPDEWWAEAGMDGFRPSAPAYTPNGPAELVALREIEPPSRFPEHPKDWRGFDRVRLISVLKGIAAGAEIEPVPLRQLPEEAFPDFAPYRFRVRNGVHRFYASIAAGFEHLPAVIA